MVSKYGAEISPHIPTITQLCLEYITYDPNNNNNYKEGDDMECDDDVEDQDSEDEYSDDDDMIWKVRKQLTLLGSSIVIVSILYCSVLKK